MREIATVPVPQTTKPAPATGTGFDSLTAIVTQKVRF